MKNLMILATFMMVNSYHLFANVPVMPLEFPRDHAGHLSNVPYENPLLLEWWYFTGDLVGEKGQDLHYFFTFFSRKFPLPNGGTQEVYWNMFSLTNLQTCQHLISRLVANSAKIDTQQLAINYDHSYVLSTSLRNGGLKAEDTSFQLKALAKGPQNEEMAIDLKMVPQTPALVHGNATGAIDIPDGGNSYYYSMPRLQTSGTVVMGDEKYVITPKSSTTWMDHQWGDFMPNQQFHWDWFAIRLEDGTDIMVFGFVDKDEKRLVHSGDVTVQFPDGRTFYKSIDSSFMIERSEYWESPLTKTKYPLKHKFEIPEIGLSLELKAKVKDQDVGFYEGAASVQGKINGQAVTGNAALELLY